jgi:carbonic anhydrase
MEKKFQTIIDGYLAFRNKYAYGDQSTMQLLSQCGQKPDVMVIACCDSRVDPSIILQCDPGDLFVVRNVANIVPPYEKDAAHHGTSAALEFGICFLKVKHLILLGHSQCGGIQALLNSDAESKQNDFIDNWVSIIKTPDLKMCDKYDPDTYAKLALQKSYQNCMSFPWIKDKLNKDEQVLNIHRWFFDIKTGQIFTYSEEYQSYKPLDKIS